MGSVVSKLFWLFRRIWPVFWIGSIVISADFD